MCLEAPLLPPHCTQLQGWDKTYCLRYVEEFEEVHFFGDKTYQVRAFTASKLIGQGKVGMGIGAGGMWGPDKG